MKFTFASIRLMSPAWVTLLCLALTPAAHAAVESEYEEKSVAVPYADLDLTQQTDVEILLGRIEKAARHACGGDPRQYWTYQVMPAYARTAFSECREDAIARSIDAMNQPALTQARAAMLSGRSVESGG